MMGRFGAGKLEEKRRSDSASASASASERSMMASMSETSVTDSKTFLLWFL